MPGISIGDALLKLGVDSSGLDTGVKKAVDDAKAQLKGVGVGLTAVGAAITASLGMATKSALDEQLGIQRLTASLKNVGVSYANVREELEAGIATLQRKTSYGDGPQRDALNELITVTGDYSKSLELLQLSTDLAASKQMDLSSAAMIVGRAANGDTQLLTRYGIVVKEGATATEVLAQMQERFGGAAEAAANPLTQLSNTFGDLVEDIGAQLLPTLKSFVASVTGIIDKVREWVKEHPELTRQIVIITGVVGGFAAVLGPILIMLPSLAAGLHLLLGPIGLVTLAVTALIAAGVALYLNWDKVKTFFINAWSQVKTTFLQNTYAMLDVLSNFTRFIPGLNKAVESAKQNIAEMIDSEKIAREARETIKVTENWAKDETRIIKEQTQKKRDELNTQKSDAQKSYDNEITALRKTYGVLEGYGEDYTESKMDEARRLSEEHEKSLDRQMDVERRAYDERIAMIDAEYSARLKLVDEETAMAVRSLNSQIDAIRAEEDAENKARRDGERADKQAELEARVAGAQTDKQRKAAQEELDKFLAELEIERTREQRQAQIDALRGQIDAVRDAAINEKDRLQTEQEAKIASEKAKLEATLTTLQIEKDGLDAALKEELIRIETARLSAELASQNRLDNTIARIEREDELLAQQQETELSKISQHVADINAETAKLQDRTIHITSVYATGGGGGAMGVGDYRSQIGATAPGIEFMQHGGMIREPTLLTRLRDMRPYAIAGESGPEPVGFGGITITGNTFNVRKESDINEVAERLVGLIRLKGGLRIA